MIKIIGTIVNANLMLVGLKLQMDDGTQKIFGLAQLKQLGFNNNQMVINGNTMQLKGSFRLNSVPMEVFMGGNDFQPVNNTVQIVGRVNNGTDDTAYAVVTGNGIKATIDVNQLRALNDLFKPVNFVVNKREDTGKVYITSKPGYPKISELPIVGGVAKQMAQRTYKKNVEVPANLSFWSLTNMLATMNGVYIKLPHVKYNAETRMAIPAEKAGATQDISNYGEFALPEFEVVTSNANLNLSFRAQVRVDITDTNGNKLFDVWSNKISTKTVYKNGKTNMSEIGIMVKNTVRDQLIGYLAGVDCGRVEDPTLRKFYAKSAGKGNADDLTIIWVSLKSIPAFCQADIDTMKAQLPVPANFVKDLFDYTCVKKALTKFTSVKRDAIKAGNGIKTVSPELAHYSPEQLKLIASSGIDTTYNSYTYKVEKTADSEDGKETKSEFAIKWEFTALKTVNVKANEKLKNDVLGLADALTQLYNSGKIDEANQFIKQTKDAANKYAKVIQMLNIVLLYNGGYNAVNTNSWADGTVSTTAAKSNTYIVINSGNQLFEQARAAVAGWNVQ